MNYLIGLTLCIVVPLLVGYIVGRNDVNPDDDIDYYNKRD